MKIFAFLALVISSTTAFAQTWKLAPVSSRHKLTALQNGKLEPFRTQPIQLRVARGEVENFQFVVTAGAKSIQKLEITPNGLASIGGDYISPQNLEIYRENFVFVAQPSGNRDLTPKWWPDALIPLNLASKTVEAGKSAVFWASLKIPLATPPGDYFGEIDFLADGAPRRLAVSITVENVTLPTPKFRGTVALYYDVLRDWYRKNGQNFSDADWDLQKKRYYDFLLDYGINAYDLPVPWNSPEAEKYLQNPRVHSVRIPPLDSPDFALALEKFKTTKTSQKAFYYWIDEPQTPADFQKVRETTEKLRKLGVKHLVTAHPNAALKDAVDIWCPNIGDFFGIGHLNLKELEAERKKGRETWLYTMVEPKFPYPTWLLDDDATSITDYSGIWARTGATGFVYSMAHGWGPKPLENLQSFEGTNGDGTLIYPSEIVGGVGPMPSIRLMLLRDAMENWALKRASKMPATRLLPHAPIALDKLKKAPVIDGNLNKTEWDISYATYGGWKRAINDNRVFSDTKSWIGYDEKNLYIALRLQNPQPGEWVAVEMAPAKIEDWNQEKWRYVVTLAGNLVIEKQTRTGRFRIESLKFQAAVKKSKNSATIEIKIPREPMVYGARFRLNLLRRTVFNGTKITLRAWPNGFDPTLMPVAHTGGYIIYD
ncbi:MAG TPA: glycoside hydrolase domain-containing protein [Abditibacterium sp.]|jgi:hypothetical protein